MWWFVIVFTTKDLSSITIEPLKLNFILATFHIKGVTQVRFNIKRATQVRFNFEVVIQLWSYISLSCYFIELINSSQSFEVLLSFYHTRRLLLKIIQMCQSSFPLFGQSSCVLTFSLYIYISMMSFLDFVFQGICLTIF